MTDVLLSGGSELDEREAAKAALEASEEQLQSLCASQAGTFVAVERRGRALQEALQELFDATKNVESRIESVQLHLDQSDDADHSLAVLSERHRVRRRTLLQHSSLLELLELPSLMDACVRSNLYEEALQVASFANTLERRHQETNNPVVQQVILQIRSRQEDLRRHLLHRLRVAVTMPQCLEIVTALRRLNSIDLERRSEVNVERVHASMEMRLQVDFLEARDAWLETKSNEMTRGTSLSMNEQLLDAIERYRTRVFEVATQFNAIFRAQTNISSDSVPLLSMWMARRVRSFIDLLRFELSRIEDSAALRDALEASVFFANSMGRLGADFTARLPEIFEPNMLSLVDSIWAQGFEQLRETLRICRDAGVASPLVSQSLETIEADAPLDNSSDLGGPLAPPRALLAVPPLARLVNAILTGLNELRRCLLPGIFAQLRSALESLLSEIKKELMDNERAVLKPGFRGEAAQLRGIAANFKLLFSQTIDPYLRGSLEAALGNKEGAIRFHETYLASIRAPKAEQGEAEQDQDVQVELDSPENESDDNVGAVGDVEAVQVNKQENNDRPEMDNQELEQPQESA